MNPSERIGVISLNQKNANCLSSEMINLFEEKLNDFEKKSSITTIVLLSENKNVFSSGADLNEYRNAKQELDIYNYLNRLGMLFLRLVFYPKNILTLVDGKSVGGALGLIAASDYIIATDKAIVKLPELTLGIAPSIISPFLRIKIGVANLKTLSFGADWLSGERMLQFGLYSELIESEKIAARFEVLKEQFGSREVDPIEKYKESFYPPQKEFIKNIQVLARENASWIWKAKSRGIFS